MHQVVGTYYFLTGLPGAGKTTIGQRFFVDYKTHNPGAVFLDGDSLRDVFSATSKKDYSLEARRALAMQYSRLALMLTRQGLDVVCCTVSMFHEIRNWNREHFSKYKEIYIQVSDEILIGRNQKGLYSGKVAREGSRVSALGIAAEFPQNPDLLIVNDGNKSLDEINREIRKIANL